MLCLQSEQLIFPFPCWPSPSNTTQRHWSEKLSGSSGRFNTSCNERSSPLNSHRMLVAASPADDPWAELTRSQRQRKESWVAQLPTFRGQLVWLLVSKIAILHRSDQEVISVRRSLCALRGFLASNRALSLGSVKVTVNMTPLVTLPLSISIGAYRLPSGKRGEGDDWDSGHRRTW